MASPALIQFPHPPLPLNNYPSSPPSLLSTVPSAAPSPKHSSSLSCPLRTHNNNKDNSVVSWTASIARHARRGQLYEAISAFSLMLSTSSPKTYPNHITLLTLLSSCAYDSSSLSLGFSLHALTLKLYPLSIPSRATLQLNTTLLNLYSKCGLARLARRLFDRMPDRNSFSFNSMIAGYMNNGEVEDAVSVFRCMPDDLRDKISWTAVIDGLVKNGFLEMALECFGEMQMAGGVEPDYVMVVALVAACAGLGALGHGMWVHRYAMTRGGDVCNNVRVANSLIDMYSRCGRVDLAHQVFEGVDNSRKTRVTWNSMIVGFAINGCCLEAMDHFFTMRMMGFKPDGVSFTGALTACSHAGMVDEGLKIYKLMEEKHGEIPMRIEHYGCVVDLLGRAGRLEEAMSLVESMMPVMGPNEVVLGSLLAACRVHGNIELAEKLAGYLVELEPDTDSNFVLLSNIYAAVGKWNGVGKVRNTMKSLGIKKSPGFSSIEIDGAFHEFVSGDRGHMQSKNVYSILELLSFEMKLHQHNDYASKAQTFTSRSSDR